MRPDVRALAIGRGGIVDGEEDVQQIAIADLFWIEGDLHHLGVACAPGANLFVGGVGDVAARVARDDVFHAPHLIEGRLQAPKAAAAQGGLLCVW